MEALWLRKEGNTRAVILFHAYTGTPADVRMLAQFLHRHDYAVYVPVFSGHGTPDVDDILKSVCLPQQSQHLLILEETL